MSDTAALTIRLDSAQRDTLAALATEHERSVSYLVRIAVERFLREVTAEEKAVARGNANAGLLSAQSGTFKAGE